ncbi:MAG: hypothetical protein AAFQ84_06875, partial [Pseudomonadota bacterium]
MKIPVFVSRPSRLDEGQSSIFDEIDALLDEFALEARTIGQSDYPTDFPLKEVRAVAKHCAGGLVLGFSQERASDVARVNRDPLPARA